jgi:hypothetical protein
VPAAPPRIRRISSMTRASFSTIFASPRRVGWGDLIRSQSGLGFDDFLRQHQQIAGAQPRPSGRWRSESSHKSSPAAPTARRPAQRRLAPVDRRIQARLYWSHPRPASA